MSHTLLIADRDRELVAELANEFAADAALAVRVV